MDRAALARDVDATCRITGEFTLRSGLVVSEYFDKYLFESRPALLRRVAEAMVTLLPANTEMLGGLELGGVPIATMMSSITELPVVFVRKEAKAYGTCRLAEGAEVNGQRITLVEDIVTTGGAACAAAVALRERGAHVDTVVCAIDRSEPGANPLDEVGLSTFAVLTRLDLDRARASAAETPSGTVSERRDSAGG